MPMFRRLCLLAVGSGVTYAQCKSNDDDKKTTTKSAPPGPRVAIIGGGVGGASCAYYLRERFRDYVTIDIYEKDKVGGRTSVTEINGQKFESGASIIHSDNAYMVSFAKQFGLEKKQSPDRAFGLSDGNELYFIGKKDEMSLGLQMFWRYGLDFPRSLFFTYMLMSKFSRIYKLQNEGHAFSSVRDLLRAACVDFVQMSQLPMRSVMRECGFKTAFTEEVAMAAVHNNYGQDVNIIHGFAGFVALAGIGSNLWSVKGGNYQIPEKLVKESKANLIHAEVTEVKLLDNGLYEVNYNKLKPRYDVVVLAAPQHERSELKLTGFPRQIDLKSPYERIVTHFIHGQVNVDVFKKPVGATMPTEITITNSRNFYNTLAVNIPVQGSSKEIDPDAMNVWKIFAKRPLSDSELKNIFTKVNSKVSVDWLAYPHFKAGEALPSFVVHRNLYYLNAIERAASAMEMSVVAGRNIALLVYNEWRGDYSRIDNEMVLRQGDQSGNLIATQRPPLSM